MALEGVEQERNLYRRVYRPEMQYSVFKLDVKAIEAVDTGEDENEANRDLTDSDIPVISAEYDALSIKQSLEGSVYNPLMLIGAESNFVVDFWQNQFLATDQESWDIENLKLGPNADSSEYLTAQLMTNCDTSNILWEWASIYMDAAVDLNRDGNIEESSSFYKDTNLKNSCAVLENDNTAQPTDKTYPERPFRFWLNNNLDLVVNKGVPSDTHIDCAGLQEGPVEGTKYEQTCVSTDEYSIHEPNETNTSAGRLDKIETYRDLEDTFAIDLSLNSETREIITSGEYSLVVKSKNIGVNLFFSDWNSNNSRKSHAYIHNHDDAVSVMQDIAGDNKQIYVGGSNDSESVVRIPKSVLQGFDGADISRINIIAEGVETNSDTCAASPDQCYLSFSIFAKEELVP